MRLFRILIAVVLGLVFYNFTNKQIGSENIFEEKDGILAVEAEHFFKQSKYEIRKWKIINSDFKNEENSEPNHYTSASGNQYVKCLPDTRTTHDDKLIAGENFSNGAGEMAVLHYKIYINNPGKYYVWVRAYSTGTEDNGIHVGIDNTWPPSGQRMQWCEGKNQWTWDSKQRTQEVHCGKTELIYLEIQEAGEHEIQFSMREDGFEFDKYILKKVYEKPNADGPKELIKKL